MERKRRPLTTHAATDGEEDFDVVIIGAGFGGLRALYEMRNLGLSSKVLQAGWETGGFRFLFETFDDLITNERAKSADGGFEDFAFSNS
jgi:flavin-dependent dehydrogenase